MHPHFIVVRKLPFIYAFATYFINELSSCNYHYFCTFFVDLVIFFLSGHILTLYRLRLKDALRPSTPI